MQLARGSRPDAEAAFRKAVETNPNLPDVHIALANYLWAAGRAEEAEQSLKKALELDPKNLLAHRALAMFYMSRGRALEAEPHMKALAEHDTSASARWKLALADYYVSINRPDEAAGLLEEIAKNKDAYSAARARTRRAGVRATRTTAEANKEIDDVLKRDPKNVPALLVKSRFLSADGKTNEAIEMARAAVRCRSTFDSGALPVGHALSRHQQAR